MTASRGTVARIPHPRSALYTCAVYCAPYAADSTAQHMRSILCAVRSRLHDATHAQYTVRRTQPTPRRYTCAVYCAPCAADSTALHMRSILCAVRSRLHGTTIRPALCLICTHFSPLYRKNSTSSSSAILLRYTVLSGSNF
jgi:hypothetical protein